MNPLRALLGAALISATTLTTFAQGTAFTYQGRLNDGANPANGIYDIRFLLYSAGVGGAQQGPILTNNAVAVSGGFFTATLDFGTGVFPGQDRWLDIAVRTNGNGAFTPLSSRQQLTPTPYAITAANAAQASGVSATNVTDILADGHLSANVALRSGGNLFTGNQTITSGNVGIGTPTPGELLDVNGNIRVADTAVIGGRQQNLATGVLTIQAPGNVSTHGAGTFGGELRLKAGNANISGAPAIGTSFGNDVVIQAGDNVFALSGGSQFNGNIRFLAGDLAPERMRIIGDNGNVGIGTTNPLSRLDVNGDVRSAGTFIGNGGSLTNLNASQLSAGTVSNAQLSSSVSLLGQTIESSEITDGTISNIDISISAAIADTKLATISTAGKVADTALSANVALRSGGNTFSSDQIITNGVLYNYAGQVVRPSNPGYAAATEYDSTNNNSGVRAMVGTDGIGLTGTANQMFVGTYTAHPLRFFTSGQPRMTIDAVGNVSVAGPVSATAFTGDGSGLSSLNAAQLNAGTLNDSRLSANVALRSGGNTFNNDQIMNGGLYNYGGQIVRPSDPGYASVTEWDGTNNNSGVRAIIGTAGYGLTPTTNYMFVGTYSPHPMNFFINAVQRMTIDTSGNVGIGTASPGSKLDVNGDVRIAGGNLNFDNGKLILAKNASGTYENFLWPRFVDDVTYLNYGTNGFNIRNSSSVTTMFMQNNGSVSIAGDVNIGIGSANKQLDVNASYNNVTMTVRERPGDTFAFAVQDSGGSDFMTLQSSATKGLYLYGTPFDTVSVFWTTFSDERLKQDIKPNEAGLNELLQLQTIRYRYKDDAKRGLSSKQEHTGVIAQKVQKVFPDAVLTDKDGYLSLQADPIFWASIHAIQELNHKVEERDAKISELEKRLSQLEKSVQALGGAK